LRALPPREHRPGARRQGERPRALHRAAHRAGTPRASDRREPARRREHLLHPAACRCGRGPSARPPAGAPAVRGLKTMRKVLIVEDDEAMSVALRDGFTYEGYAVTVAKDGEAGLHLATTAGPDLILLDVMLPKMTGLDVCRKLRNDGSAVPIIMLTARGQE